VSVHVYKGQCQDLKSDNLYSVRIRDILNYDTGSLRIHDLNREFLHILSGVSLFKLRNSGNQSIKNVCFFVLTSALILSAC